MVTDQPTPLETTAGIGLAMAALGALFLWRLSRALLDTLLGAEEPFEYEGTTTPAPRHE